MLGAMVKKLPGRSRAEIEQILDPSPDTPYFKSIGRDLIYLTGPERNSFISIDSEWLLIWVDKQGIYERHAIVSD